MISPFGQVYQLGYVVDSLDVAIEFWAAKMAVGPWFVPPPLEIADSWYRLVQSPLSLRVAYGHSGGVQLELLEPASQPSLFREFLDSGQRGLHHVGYMVDDFAGGCAAAGDRGFELLQRGRHNGKQFAYFCVPALGSVPVIELAESSPGKRARFDSIMAAARCWDGTDPIRTF